MKVEWEKGKADLETEMERSSILQTALILQDLSIQGGAGVLAVKVCIFICDPFSWDES